MTNKFGIIGITGITLDKDCNLPFNINCFQLILSFSLIFKVFCNILVMSMCPYNEPLLPSF